MTITQTQNPPDLLIVYETRKRDLLQAGFSEDQAAYSSWRGVAADWYRRHGTKIPPSRCAGCGEAFDQGEPSLDLLHGDRERLHIVGGNLCEQRFAKRWQSAALVALENAGVPTPERVKAEVT